MRPAVPCLAVAEVLWHSCMRVYGSHEAGPLARATLEMGQV